MRATVRVSCANISQQFRTGGTVQVRPLRAAPLLLLRPQGDDCRVPPGAAVLQTAHHCRGMPGDSRHVGDVCDVLLTAVTRRGTPAAAWRWRVAGAECGAAPGGCYKYYSVLVSAVLLSVHPCCGQPGGGASEGCSKVCRRCGRAWGSPGDRWAWHPDTVPS